MQNQNGKNEFLKSKVVKCLSSFIPFSSLIPFLLPGVFQLYDTDHDGYITRDQVEGVVIAMHHMLGHMTSVKVVEGLQEEDEDEVETPQERVARLVEVMDTVRDIKVMACALS